MKLNKASFTVEISLLMPIILAVLVMLCMTAVWLYDNNTTYANCVKVVMYAKGVIDSGEELEQSDLDNYAEDTKANGMLGALDLSITASKSLLTLKVSNSGSVELPLNYWMRSMNWPYLSRLDGEATCVVIRPTTQIREYRLAKGIVE